ncbi:MAG: YncE family protein [Woeseiaceae bacterium]
MRFVLALLLFSGFAHAADISDPTQFMFVGDRKENVIDVISLKSADVVHQIETSIRPDHIIATPFAPILMYADIEAHKIVFYNLDEQKEWNTVELPIAPRHAVLDTTGAKIALSDDVDGGFVLIHAYKRDIEFALTDFPATADVLFDPNDVDIYYSNDATGSLGLLDMNTQRTYEMPLGEEGAMHLSPPSRSLDARYVYVSNIASGEVYSLNAYSQVIFNTFDIGGKPARPYTTPQGAFLYLMDEESGNFISIVQNQFAEYATAEFDKGVDLVTVGEFDRMNLFLSTQHKHWYIFDNVRKEVVKRGEFKGQPIGALGAADGKTAYVAFSDAPEIAIVDLGSGEVDLAPATSNGSRSFTIGLSNNVCH